MSTTASRTHTRLSHGLLIVALVMLLLITLTDMLVVRSPLWQARLDASVAARALARGDTYRLEELLSKNRDNTDFAYFFASDVTPSELSDAVSDLSETEWVESVDGDEVDYTYEQSLVDLAGTVALATHGTEDRALPPAWATEFIVATTSPSDLAVDGMDASQANLFLLLSRGYWSTDFLQSVTSAYYHFVQSEGGSEWPESAVEGDVAPSPSGVALTDGILALSAALTANPEASEWAFIDFLPGNVEIEGTGYSIGRFTHFLAFEYQFPESESGQPVGETATLTALSAAIESATWASDIPEGGFVVSPDDPISPMHDAAVLEALAQELVEKDSQCSWNPGDYWNCVIIAADVVWKWAQQWGHLVLDLLTMASFIPMPFTVIGVSAGVLNATWHSIEGDYLAAGLSVAAVVPGIALAKVAAGAKGVGVAKGAAAASKGADAQKGAAAANTSKSLATATGPIGRSNRTFSTHIERPTTIVKEGVADGRVKLRTATKEAISKNAPKDKNGNFIDPNTGQVIPAGSKFDIGHKPGYEWRCIVEAAITYGWTRQELIDYANNPNLYQVETRSSNRSHKYEGTECLVKEGTP